MDELLWILLAIAAGGYFLVAPALGVAAFMRAGRRFEEITGLRRELAGLRRQIDDLRVSPAAGPETPPPAEPEAEAPPATEAPPTAEAPGVREPLPDAEFESARPPETEPPEPEAAAAPPSWRETAAARAAAKSTAEPKAKLGFEQWLASRGLAWLGAATLALAGVFLVKYSIERGWVGPAVRVTLGLIAGIALTVGGEWLRRRPLQRAIAAIGPNYLPPALTAAGLFTAFASVYAAYGLYGFLPPLVAFALLAALAFAAFGLALLQGPLIAALGLLGGFATPLLVSTGSAQPWPLFGYLLVLVAGSLAVVRHKDWWWLAWGALAGAAAWVLLWLATVWSAGDALPLGLFLLALAAVFYLVRRGHHATVELVAWPRGLAALPAPDQVAWGAALAIAVLTFMLVRQDGYGPTSLALLALLCVLYLAAGDREAVFDGLAPVAAAMAVALIAAWHLPAIVGEAGPHFVAEGRPYGQLTGPVLPPGLQAFATVAGGFGLLFGLGGFLCLWRARRPALLAAVSASTPVVLLAVAYWRIEDFGVSFKWSVVAVVLAAALVGAAARVRRAGASPSHNLALGAYAAATVGALGLAATMALEQAWLTVALSLQLPALAWLHGRLDAKPLRWVAWAPAVVVLVRLVLNHNVLDYAMGTVPAFNWVLYGYGLPALFFWLAARGFRRKGDDLLVAVLEAGALAFTVLLVSLEIRSLVAGSLAEPDYRLLERGLQTAAWLALAYGWLLHYRKSGRPVLLWGWRILAGLAGAHTLFVQVLGANPMITGEPVGAWPVVNLLALNYLVPAGFALAFAGELRKSGQERIAAGAALWGLFLVFLYLTFEVRRAFHGPVLDIGPETDAELYAYSAVWLCYALGLLAIGVWKRLIGLRYVSFALLFLVVGKVLLIDTAALSGVLRVLSVAGLAIGLLGIVYFYQRFVFPPRGPGESSEEPPSPAEPVKTPS